MREITDSFRLYRELARITWNLGLRTQPDGEYEFVAVERGLFEAIVLSRLPDYRTDQFEKVTYYPGALVRFASLDRDVDVLSGALEDGIMRWQRKTVHPDQGFRYVSLFDFDTLGGHFRDFTYVRVIVPGAAQNQNHMLLESGMVRLFAVEP